MNISEVIKSLEEFAPPALQEGYDNSGLIVGDSSEEVKGVLISLDCIESVVDEAIRKGCNLIVSHHPIVFSGLKRLNGKNYIERVVMKAIKNDIALYAIHTNLDNVNHGVNQRFAERIGLLDCRVLRPMQGRLLKLSTYVPVNHSEKVLSALFNAGAGNIGDYDECSFSVEGKGTFRAGGDARPYVGQIGKRHSEKEDKVEVVVPDYLRGRVLQALNDSHPYEEVAYELYRMENDWKERGSGMIGNLAEEMDEADFLQQLKQQMNAPMIRCTPLTGNRVKTVAICGGSGSFLLGDAMAAKADVFVTGDFKYHQFFDAEGKIVIADIGHYESEQFTVELLSEYLRDKFSTFAIQITEENTNPVNYI